MGRSHFDPADGPRLMRGILENPFDNGPRLTYSDWLEERGQEERAKLIRLQIEESSIPIHQCDSIYPGCTVHDGQVVAHNHKCRGYDLCEQIGKILSDSNYSVYDNIWPDDYCQKRMLARVERGFVGEIRLTCEQFMAHAEHLFREHPITQVELTDKEPYRDSIWIRETNNLSCSVAGYLRLNSTQVFDRNRSTLPSDIFARIKGVQDYMNWNSFQHPNDQLSDACVALGRDLAELPPLEPTNGIESETGAYIANLVRQGSEVMHAVPLDDVYRRAGLNRPTSEPSGESGEH